MVPIKLFELFEKSKLVTWLLMGAKTYQGYMQGLDQSCNLVEKSIYPADSYLEIQRFWC